VSERDILNRLEGIVDRWLRATPAERTVLVHEKIRLEELLDRTRAEEKEGY